MSIPLTGTNGYFTRLGKVRALHRAVNLFRDTGRLRVATISGNGTTVTVTTQDNHGFVTGDTVKISGSSISGYNGSFTITATGNTTFTYANATTGTPSTSIPIYTTKTAGVGYFAVRPYAENIEGQFQGADQTLIDSLFAQVDGYEAVHSSILNYLSELAQAITIKMANDDTPLASLTLKKGLELLISQLDTSGDTVLKPTVSISVTASSLSAPTLNSATPAAGGSLSAGTYYYKITATTASGETTLSNEVNGTTAGGNLTLALSWNAVLGATGYRIYRGTSTGAQDKLVTVITSGSTTSYNDTGATVTATATPTVNRAYKNKGSAVCVASVLNPKGVQKDYVYNETITVKATADSQGAATIRQEPFSVVGAARASDSLDSAWPAGSGVNITQSAIDPSQDASGNLLTNSDFETFTVANTPDKWTIVSGAAGSTIFAAGASNSFAGSNALEFRGDGSTLHSITQKFDDVTNGTSSKLDALAVLPANVWIKLSATPAAGVLKFDLIDGAGSPAVVQDQAGADNTLTLDLTTVPANIWVPLNGFFRTPQVLPTTGIKARLRTSTAISDGISLYIDEAAIASPSEIYAGGPYVQVFAGGTKTIIDDSFSVVVTNRYDSPWQLAFWSWFDMPSLGLQLQSSSSPTILGSLIA